MGTYQVWVAGKHPVAVMQEYDEGDRNFPNDWPGMTFEYAEPDGEPLAAAELSNWKTSQFPEALVHNHGQIVREFPENCGFSRRYGIPTGVTAMRKWLENNPGVPVTRFWWHC